MIRWGIVSTIKAPLRTIARFAAHHLELGAHRLFIYLDDADAEAAARLSAHPKIRVVAADAAHWTRGRRPEKHQARQSANARHAYRRKSADLDWLAHIDVDEFLWPLRPLEDQLAELPPGCLCARIRPIEALSAEDTDLEPGLICFKAAARARPLRNSQTDAIYPTFGAHLNGGFLSHLAGKLFIRTGQDDLQIKIHNVIRDGVQNPGQVELAETELCHMHAPGRAAWRENFGYRLERGSYRPSLAPTRARERGGLTMHELFRAIMDAEGDAGLDRFYDEVCRATPALRARLDAHGLLRCYRLDLDAKLARHFPDLASDPAPDPA